MAVPRYYLDLLDCGYGLSFNTMIPDSEFLLSINKWFTQISPLTDNFYHDFTKEVELFVSQLLAVDPL